MPTLGPIYRWKLAGGDENNPPAGDGGAGAAAEARLRQRRYIDGYQRFRHHIFIFLTLLGA